MTQLPVIFLPLYPVWRQEGNLSEAQSGMQCLQLCMEDLLTNTTTRIVSRIVQRVLSEVG